MKFSRSDFYLMRWSILAVCASALVSVAALYSSGKYVENTQNERHLAQSMLNDANNHLVTARQDQENMAIYADEYGALIGWNIIGDGQRLDWMEGLENIRRKNLVTDFRYSIAPQKTFVSRPPIDSGNFAIHYSEMKLQFDLLHEGQLLNFFDALRTDIKGWYQLEGCTLQRSVAAIGGDNDTPTAAAYLKAECGGGWITLKNRNTP
ncbi:MAG: hypothetical protein A3F73_13970 [Gallionellales bacterium RIFCSPLOWO2_12_FULL_59_22]|nr:MAG: hypothetical protein A3H99_12370 [Gallionellales bacterium RIFCSPLOWO2_02_FULL_59_110]OGT04943.1 MAG: hypothetical protein A2Z65_05250 [Gallionellales bacterium RIFCSPLOWO2_02_58_13]OGT13920.1 MAG: hypothetical protein A3F73_13970 [Gallionellales bacterium RIFCSPLOWO2_12_FULL_59_22]